MRMTRLGCSMLEFRGALEELVDPGQGLRYVTRVALRETVMMRSMPIGQGGM